MTTKTTHHVCTHGNGITNRRGYHAQRYNGYQANASVEVLFRGDVISVGARSQAILDAWVKDGMKVAVSSGDAHANPRTVRAERIQ